MQNILIVTNSSGGGGAERSMHLLANELHNHGVPVVVLQVNKEGADRVKVNSEVYNLGRNHKSGVIELVKIIIKFRGFIHQFNPKVVILNCDLPEMLSLFLPSNIPLIVVEHANPAWSTRIRVGRLVRFLHVRRKTRFVAVSDHLRIWPKMSNPSFVTENMVLVDESFKLKNKGNIKRLLFVGRLASIQKRPEIVLEMSAKTGIPVTFIGQGPELPKLQSDAQDRSLEAEFLGFLEDPWSQVRDGDLLIIPSKFEGDGLVVVEALARGIPILISDIPDFRRFNLNEVNYCLDLDDFVSRVTESKNDISIFLVEEVLTKCILDLRSPEEVLRKWEKVFESI